METKAQHTRFEWVVAVCILWRRSTKSRNDLLLRGALRTLHQRENLWPRTNEWMDEWTANATIQNACASGRDRDSNPNSPAIYSFCSLVYGGWTSHDRRTNIEFVCRLWPNVPAGAETISRLTIYQNPFEKRIVCVLAIASRSTHTHHCRCLIVVVRMISSAFLCSFVSLASFHSSSDALLAFANSVQKPPCKMRNWWKQIEESTKRSKKTVQIAQRKLLTEFILNGRSLVTLTRCAEWSVAKNTHGLVRLVFFYPFRLLRFANEKCISSSVLIVCMLSSSIALLRFVSGSQCDSNRM